MATNLTRRDALLLLGAGACASAPGHQRASANWQSEAGIVVGDQFGDAVGQRVLQDGGNAIDAIVAAAFTASVTSLANCGLGGYGGHLVVGLANGRTAAVDFNGTAPLSMDRDFFSNPPAQGGYLQRGWLSAGVPGVLAGLQLAVDEFGTRSIADLMQPAISIARDGFELPVGTARAIQQLEKTFRQDPGSSRLLLPDGKPPQAGSRFRNRELAGLLERLAEAGSVAPFYEGDIAQQIASEFHKHGGLVTVEDLQRFRARLVPAERLQFGDIEIHTAPLTAGGVTCLQALKILDAVAVDQLTEEAQRSHAQLEALRLAWSDRLKYFGDPDFVEVPLERLMSSESIAEQAQQVKTAVAEKRPISLETKVTDQHGTCHLSAVDRDGNLASLTFTHGQGFGAGVTVAGLGLILGHGMSRFDSNPEHPNSPGPGKRPLNNMCPTIIARGGQPVAAIGGRGGRRIPNAMIWSLLQLAQPDASFQAAIAGKRLHTEGDLNVVLQGEWSAVTRDYLKSLGYNISDGAVARIDAVGFDPQRGLSQKRSR